MKRVALLGHPVGHSVSPDFQNAAFAALGLDVHYEGIDVTTEQLAEVVDRLRQSEWLGANVTVPHKRAVFRLADEVDELARQVGAVNTLVNRDGRLFATNTDVAGFVQSVEAAGGRIPGASCLVLGAGGSARAVVFGLAQRGAAIALSSRRRERAEELMGSIRELFPSADIKVVEWAPELLADAARESSIVVNCTPIGMLHGPNEAGSPLEAKALRPGQLVVDLVYNPPETPLLALARRAGAAAINGVEMLIHQGAASFEHWTGRPAPIDVMRQAATAALTGSCS